MKNIKSKVFLVTIGLVLSTTLSAMPANATGTIVDTTIDANPGVANYGYFNAPMGTQLGFTFQTGTKDVGGAIDIFTESSKTIQFHLDFTTGDPTSTYITDSPGPFEYRIEIGVDQSATQINMTIDGATPLTTRPAGFPEPPKSKSPAKPTVKPSTKPRVKPFTKPIVSATPSANPTRYQVLPSYLRRYLSAVRDGTSAQVQWISHPGENSYKIYAGKFNPGDVKVIPNNLMKNHAVIWLNDKTGKIITGNIVFNPDNAITLSSTDVSKAWYYSKKITISNDINTVLLESFNSNGTKTFDFRTAISLDGSFTGRAWKGACIISSWGEPIANDVLKASQLSLKVIGQVTGGSDGAIAEFGNSIIEEVKLKTDYESATGLKDKAIAGTKLVKGTIVMELAAQKNDKSILKLGSSLLLKRWPRISGVISKIDTNPSTKKVLFVFNVGMEVTDAAKLYSSIIDTSTETKKNLDQCKALN